MPRNARIDVENGGCPQKTTKNMSENLHGIKIEEIFNEHALKEIRELFRDDKNEHIVFLKNIVKKNGDIKTQLRALAEYGFSHIKNEEDDFALADYFFVLSEIRGIKQEVRSFFMDVMVFCEDKQVEFKSVSSLKDHYDEKVFPLLKTPIPQTPSLRKYT